MRYFVSLIAIAGLFGSATCSALAQPSAVATKESPAITDAPSAPAAPQPNGRRVPPRRDAATQKPLEAPPPSLATGKVANLGMMTGGPDDTLVQIGSDLATVINSETVRVLPLIGKGSLQNLADLFNLRGVDLAFVAADSARFAEANRLYPALRNRVQYIAKLCDQEIHVLAAPDVYTVADLAGRTVNVDVVGSGTAVTAPAVFEAMHTPIKQVHDTPAVALEKLKRGDIAALVYTSAKPNRLFASIPPDAGLHLLQLPVSDALFDAYVPAKLTHADYPSLIAEGEDVQTWAVPVLLTAYNWPAGTERYANLAAFTDLFFSRLPDLQQPPYHAKWREVDIRATVPGWTRAPYAQRWLDQSRVQSVASTAPAADGIEQKAFNEWAAGLGLTNMTATQSTQLFSLWRLRQSQR